MVWLDRLSTDTCNSKTAMQFTVYFSPSGSSEISFVQYTLAPLAPVKLVYKAYFSPSGSSERSEFRNLSHCFTESMRETRSVWMTFVTTSLFGTMGRCSVIHTDCTRCASSLALFHSSLSALLPLVLLV